MEGRPPVVGTRRETTECASVTSRAREAQALANRRIADEYDAAQARGEVATQGRPRKGFSTEPFFVPGEYQELVGERLDQLLQPAKLSDIPSLTKKDVHEARQIRDAEEADPGVVKRVLDEAIEAGEEPTKPGHDPLMVVLGNSFSLYRCGAIAPLGNDIGNAEPKTGPIHRQNRRWYDSGMGEPIYNRAEVAETICERLSNGEPLAAICRSDSMPTVRTWLRWCDEDEAIAGEYSRALAARAEWFEGERDRIRKTAVDRDSAAAARVQLTALEWSMSKCAPKRYGDRIDVAVDANLDLGATIDRARQRVLEARRVDPDALPSPDEETGR